MEIKRVLLIAGGALAAILLQTASARLHAEAQTELALSGQVTSAEEGPMEGVAVSAKKDGSTISVSVVTNAAGRFAFPVARLEPGHYALKARAAGSHGIPDGAEIINLTASILMAAALVPYGVRMLAGREPGACVGCRRRSCAGCRRTPVERVVSVAE